MTEPFDAERQVRAMLAQGWRWCLVAGDVLVHPENHQFRAHYNRAAGTMTISPELARHLDLVIPTPTSKSKSFWRKPYAGTTV